MIHPDIGEFMSLASPGALVPVYKEIVADLETPVTAYMKISEGEAYTYLLESVAQTETIGRYSFLGANPSIIIRSRGKEVSIRRDGSVETFESEDPLNELRKLLAAYHPVPVDGVPAFHGGAVGYMSYDQVRFFEDLPDENPHTAYLRCATAIISPSSVSAIISRSSGVVSRFRMSEW